MGDFQVKKVLLITMGLIFLSGCAMQADLVDLENEVRKMKAILLETKRDVALMQKPQRSEQEEQLAEQNREKMARIETETKEKLNNLQKNQADFEVRFDQLSTDAQVIQGRLEENNHKLSELSEGIDDQETAIQELSRKLDLIETRMNETQRSPDNKILLPGKDIDPNKDIKPVLPPPKSTGPHPVPMTQDTDLTKIAPSDLYNQAYKDYMAGNYDLAITGFSNYLRQSPTGTLASNALYWIGECYYSKADYPKAVSAFESVTIDFPRSEKVVGSLLKMGYSYEKMGNNSMALVYYKKVIEQFPFSQEAALAKVKLTELK